MTFTKKVFTFNQNDLVAWYCQSCGRMEAKRDVYGCPHCGKKMQRCSRYEWFLHDSLKTILAFQGADFDLRQQVPVRDRRGNTCYFDLYVWVKGSSVHGGYGELINVNGPGCRNQERHSPGARSRDTDSQWYVVSNLQLQHPGIQTRLVLSEECARNKVFYTAVDIADELMHRADHGQ